VSTTLAKFVTKRQKGRKKGRSGKGHIPILDKMSENDKTATNLSAQKSTK